MIRLICSGLLIWLLSTHVFADRFFKGQPFSDITQQENGLMWVAGASGVWRFNGQAWQHHHHRWVESLAHGDGGLFLGEKNGGVANLDNGVLIPEKTIALVRFDNKGQLWIATQSQLYRQKMPSSDLELVMDKVRVRALAFIKKQILIGTEKGLFKLENNSKTKLIEQYVYDIAVGNGQFFVATNPYFYSVNRAGEVRRLDDDSDPTFTGLAYDASNHLLWVTDYGGKISLRQPDTFEKIKHQVPIYEGIVRKMIVDQSATLWVIGSEGVHRYSTPHVKLSIGHQARQSWQQLLLYGDKRLLIEANNIYQINAGADGLVSLTWLKPVLQNNFIYSAHIIDDTLWIGSLNGLFKADLLKQQAAAVVKGEGPVIANMVAAVLPTVNPSQLLIGTVNTGMHLFDTVTLQVDSFGSGEIHAALMRENGDIIYGQAGQIFLMDKELAVKGKITLTPEQVKVTSIISDSHQLFVTTYGQGVFRVDLQTNQVKRLARYDSKNTAFLSTQAYKDSLGTLWIAAEDGLYYLDQNDRLIRVTSDYSFADVPILENGAGRLMTGTNKGIVEWRSDLSENVNAVNLLISDIKNGDQVLKLAANGLSVPAVNDGLTIQVASNNFRPGAYTPVFFQVGGYDSPETWRSATNGLIFVPPLEGGNYALHIKSTNDLQTLTLLLTLTVPIYNHPAMWIPYLGFFLLVMGLLLKEYRHKKQLLEHSVREATENEHRTKVTLDKQIDNVITPQIEKQNAFIALLQSNKDISEDLKLFFMQIIQSNETLLASVAGIRENMLPRRLLEEGLVTGLTQQVHIWKLLNYDVSLNIPQPFVDGLDSQQRTTTMRMIADVFNYCSKQKTPLVILLNEKVSQAVVITFIIEKVSGELYDKLVRQTSPIHAKLSRKLSKNRQQHLLLTISYDKSRLIDQVLYNDRAFKPTKPTQH